MSKKHCCSVRIAPDLKAGENSQAVSAMPPRAPKSQILFAAPWIRKLNSPISRIVQWCKDVGMRQPFHWRPSSRSLIILSGLLTLSLWGFAVITARGMTERLIIATTDIQVQMAEQVRLIGVILQRSSEVERKARLVILLSDPSLREPYERESYEKSRAAYRRSMEDLSRLVSDPEVILIVQELIEEESMIHRQMEGFQGHPNVPPSLDQAFADFSERTMTLAMRLDAESRGALVRNVDASRQLLRDYQRHNAVALVLALALIALIHLGMKRIREVPPSHEDP